ncbi:hypothetical protein B0J17DRAFT_667992 [Rhizoctonia solani]|nr:hypothetical protein B0J17DRAFT_667992 [Rhizoctonia solani]
MTVSATSDSHEIDALVPPQLPPFLASVFDLKPIVGDPTREQVKLVHEAVRALNNFLHTPELRDTDLSIELSQHLFDIQMTCHRQKYPTSILPNDAVYEPPTLPAYIPIELKSVTGPPSNEEIASTHAALRISESFANVPSIFDPDLHVQLSQHLFDIQLARHVQRSIVKRLAPAASAPQGNIAPRRDPGDTENPPLEQPSSSNDGVSHQTSKDTSELRKGHTEEWKRILVGTQNSLARGYNSSSTHSYYYNGTTSISHDLGAHSLINDQGEVPEVNSCIGFTIFRPSSSRKAASRHRFQSTISPKMKWLDIFILQIGEEMIEEQEEVKIKSGMIDDARALLSRRLSLSRR